MTNGFYIIILLSLIVLILGLFFNRKLLTLINVSSDLMEEAHLYSGILLIGAVYTACYNYESAILRANGNGIIPLFILILSAILNIVLDLFFVLVLHMVIAGAALSTILAQFICYLLC